MDRELPSGVETALHDTLIKAQELAERGKLAAGDALLQEGLGMARHATAEGYAWGPELECRYETAIAAYTEDWGVCLEPAE